MHADITPLIAALLIFVSALISLRAGLSVAIIEILLGSVAGNLGIEAKEWMQYLAGFGGIFLTYLAGTEVDTRLLRKKFKASFLIGFFSFLVPFLATAAYAYFIEKWTLQASLLCGTALSTTSLAVVYSVLVETGLTHTQLGKMLMAATFITDMGTALALSILFINPTLYTLIFILVSLLVIVLVNKFSLLILRSERIANKVIEPEIKFIFLVLIVFMFFANLGESHAVLPAFVLGLVMSKHFKEERKTKLVRNRMRTVAYALITPLFFMVGGMKISFEMLAASAGLFVVFFIVKIVAKFMGVFYFARKFIPNGSTYTTLLMSTGLTFGTISSLFGLQSGIINQNQYSVLVGVVVASAVIPTFIAQKWFAPVSEEDVWENGEE